VIAITKFTLLLRRPHSGIPIDPAQLGDALKLPATLTVSDDCVAHLGRNPFADDDRCDDDQQNERNLGPGEHGDRGVEWEADAAGAHQAQHRRLADVDVPTEHRNAGERRQEYAVTCAPLAPVARTAVGPAALRLRASVWTGKRLDKSRSTA